MIIDDEEQLRKLLTRIIRLEKFHVEEAGTLKAAFDCLQKKQIDIVLCDVKLPDYGSVRTAANRDTVPSEKPHRSARC